MPSPTIRPIALAVVRRRDELLVLTGHDPVTGAEFFRPLGGGIELGERAEHALHREMREELDVTLETSRLLGVLENLFDYGGQPGHEIVFVFDAVVKDRSFYTRDHAGHILDEGSPVCWMPRTMFSAGEARLYPEGLLALLDSPTSG